MVFGMARRSELQEHQKRCLEDNAQGRQEQQAGFNRIEGMIRRLEDQMRSDLREIREDISKKHEENQTAIKVIWKALFLGMGVLIGALWYAAENGGLAGLIHKAL